MDSSQLCFEIHTSWPLTGSDKNKIQKSPRLQAIASGIRLFKMLALARWLNASLNKTI